MGSNLAGVSVFSNLTLTRIWAAIVRNPRSCLWLYVRFECASSAPFLVYESRSSGLDPAGICQPPQNILWCCEHQGTSRIHAAQAELFVMVTTEPRIQGSAAWAVALKLGLHVGWILGLNMNWILGLNMNMGWYFKTSSSSFVKGPGLWYLRDLPKTFWPPELGLGQQDSPSKIYGCLQ